MGEQQQSKHTQTFNSFRLYQITLFACISCAFPEMLAGRCVRMSPSQHIDDTVIDQRSHEAAINEINVPEIVARHLVHVAQVRQL